MNYPYGFSTPRWLFDSWGCCHRWLHAFAKALSLWLHALHELSFGTRFRVGRFLDCLGLPKG